MQDILQPIIHKTSVQGLQVNVASSGLSIGDSARLERLVDGRIGIFAQAKRWRFGVFPHRGNTLIGSLSDESAARISDALDSGGTLRTRIVGLTPEHLMLDGHASVDVSVWGNLALELHFDLSAASRYAG
jgi:hypothetical protein